MFLNIHISKKRHHNSLTDKNSSKIMEDFQKSFSTVKANAIPIAINNKENNGIYKGVPRQKQRNKAHSQPFKIKMRQNLVLKPVEKIKPVRLQINPHFRKTVSQESPLVTSQKRIQISARELVETKIIPLSINNHLFCQYNPTSYIIRTENLAKLLTKAALSFLDATEYEQEASFLNPPLRELKEIVTIANKKDRSKMNKLVHGFSISHFEDYEEKVKCSQFEWECLKARKVQLQQECHELLRKKEDINQYTQDKMAEIQQQNIRMTQNLKNIDLQERKQSELKIQIQSKQALVKKITELSQSMLHYVQSQEKNKLVQLASEQYKQIQSEIYEYAVYLQANQLANSLNYQSLPLQYFNSLISTLEDSLKTLNKTLIHNQALPIEEKQRGMRDFVLRMHQAYQKKDGQQQKALDFKTKCIIKFVDMMKKWLDNWTLKQEYLVGLRKEFAAHSIAFESVLEKTKKDLQGKNYGELSKEWAQMGALYSKLKENYLLGNSFY